MSREIEPIAIELFNKIRTRFPAVELGDDRAKDTQDPELARFFNFTYIGSDDEPVLIDNNPEKPARVTISLIDEESLKLYYAQNITKGMEEEQRLEWYAFIRNIRKFAKRNGLRFDARDLDKDGLELQDVKQQAKTDDVVTAAEVSVMESRMYGRVGKPKLSIGEHGGTKVLVFHSEKVDEEKRGARARKIECIFLETQIGERLKLESKYLPGAFAMAEHLNQGGNRDDERGKHITQLCQEMSALRRFVRLKKNKQFEDDTTADAVKKAIHDYNQTRSTVKRMSHPKYYLEYFKEYAPTQVEVTDEDIAAVRERFAEKIYDERIEEALPIIAREMKALEEWAEDVYESTWNKPDNVDKIRALRELLKTPIHCGEEGIDAITKINPIIGDDELNNQIVELASPMGSGVDTDVRPLIKEWLLKHLPTVLKDLEFGQNNIDNAQTNWVSQTSPAQDNHEYADSSGGRGNSSWNMTF
jgi:hypothetical protein